METEAFISRITRRTGLTDGEYIADLKYLSRVLLTENKGLLAEIETLKKQSAENSSQAFEKLRKAYNDVCEKLGEAEIACSQEESGKNYWYSRWRGILVINENLKKRAIQDTGTILELMEFKNMALKAFNRIAEELEAAAK